MDISNKIFTIGLVLLWMLYHFTTGCVLSILVCVMVYLAAVAVVSWLMCQAYILSFLVSPLQTFTKGIRKGKEVFFHKRCIDFYTKLSTWEIRRSIQNYSTSILPIKYLGLGEGEGKVETEVVYKCGVDVTGCVRVLQRGVCLPPARRASHHMSSFNERTALGLMANMCIELVKYPSTHHWHRERGRWSSLHTYC